MIHGAKEIVRVWVARWFASRLAARSEPLPPFSDPLLIVAPHPDDETLGCGGLIARQTAAGAPVQVVFVTDGEASHRGHPQLSSTDLGVLRREEALAALATLGVPNPRECATFLSAPDGELDKLSEARRTAIRTSLEAILAKTRPRFVCAPYREGGSSEHTAVYEIVESACAASKEVTLLEYPVWAWWNAFRLRPRLDRAASNYRLPLDQTRQVKAAALRCHHSQVEPTPPWRQPVLPRSLAAACGGSSEFYFRRRRDE